MNDFLGYHRDITDRKWAEEALKGSEEKFRAIFDNASDGMFLVDLETRKFVMCNAACAKMLGYAQEEFPNLDIADIHPGEDLPLIYEQIGKFSRGEAGIRSDMRFTRKDGSIFYTDLSPALVMICEKKYLILIFRDITERKRAEKIILNLNRMYAILSNISKTIVKALTHDDLFRETCQIAVDIGKFNYAWIGILDQEKKTIIPFAHKGRGLCHRIKASHSYIMEPDSRGPAATAIHTGKCTIVNDIVVDHYMQLWENNIQSCGSRSLALVPIFFKKEVFGVLHVCANEVDYFTKEEMGLLEEIGSELSFALDSLDEKEQRQKAEDALRESEEKFRIQYQDSPIPVFTWQKEDDDFVLIGFNSMAVAATKGVASSFTGKTASELYKDRPDILLNFNRCYVEKRTIRVEMSSQHFFPGRIITATFGFIPPDMVMVYIEDITERKQAEEALKESEDIFKYIFEYSVVGKSFTLPSGEINVNKALCKMLGYTKDELQNKRWQEITHPDDIALTQREIDALLSGEQDSVRFNKRFMRKDGSNIWVDMSSSLRRDKEGKPLYLMTSMSDITERKQTEEALRESDERYRRITDTVTDYIFTSYIENGRVVKTVHGPGCIAITGFSAEEYAADPYLWFNIVFPEDRDRVVEHASRILTDIDPLPIEHRIQRKNGSVGWVLNTPVPHRDSTGALISYDGLINDITKRKHAEDKLRESEEKFRTLFEAIPIPMFYKDIDGRYLGCNQSFEAFLGKSRNDIVGKTVYEMGPKEIADEYSRRDRELFDNPGSQTYEWKIKAASYEMRDVIFSKATFVDAQRNVAGLIGAILDITNRKQAEQSLLALNYRQEALLSAIPNIIMEVDNNKVYTWTNRAGLDFFGEDVIGREAAFYFESEQETYSIVQPLFNGQEDVIYLESWQKRKDGKKRLLAWWCRALKDGAGKVTGALSSARDITEERKLEEQFLQSQKMEAVGRLAGGVAHDFNNMLSIIIGHAELALGSVDPSDPLHADLEEIQKAANRSANLTRQLLAFARKQTVTPKVLDLNETVEGMLKMLRRLIGEDIDLAWNPGHDLRQVKFDPSQIDQILANLCVNARDAITDVGKVTIETANVAFDEAYCAEHEDVSPGEYVMLAVSDNGCGMDKKTLSKLFEPFFTTKEAGKGTGLGLSTVYGIVKQNNGFIDVSSEPGEGTTFKIYLPFYEGKTALFAVEGPLEVIQSGPETILLVEDEPAILKLVKTILGRMGYSVLTASTPGEAIRLAQEYAGQIHLLMTDVVMPEMNGRDLAKHLLSLYPNIKRLFMSGYTADVIAHHGVLDEGVHFIQKPFSIQTLAAKVREALEQK